MAAEMLQIPWGRIPIHLQHKGENRAIRLLKTEK